MKKSVALMAILLIGVFAFAARPVKAQQTEIKMIPAVVTGILPGATITEDVFVYIPGPTKLLQWVLSVSWNPAVLDFVSQTEGNFIKNQTGSSIFVPGAVDPVAGKVEGVTCGSLSGDGVIGAGVIVTFQWQAKAVGSSVLDLLGDTVAAPKPMWLDPTGNQYEFDLVTDGSVTVVPEFPEFLVVPLFILMTLVTVVLTKKLWMRKRWDHLNAPRT